MRFNFMVSIGRWPGWVASGALCLALAACGAFFGDDTSVAAQDTAIPLTPGLSLIAGNVGGPGSANAAIAVNARFYYPNAIASDASGNLYVAERDGYTIRKITPAGVVTTLAGTAYSPGSADGTGAAARFSEAYGITADASGNVYVADSFNYTIRQITPAGVVTTLAGTAGSFGNTNGTGAAARFNFPAGMTTDGAGNLFVLDSNNHTIRKIVIATGVVTTLAGMAGNPGIADGTGAVARFRYPEGIVSDGAGNLYVADTANHTIRKIVIATGVVTTPMGTAGSSGSADGTGAAAQFQFPAGMAIDTSGKLFVSDQTAHTIRQVVIATGVVTTLAGTAGSSGSTDGTGAAARFFLPYGLAIDPSGNMYVADRDNHTIRQIVPATGVVTTFAGVAEVSGSADGTGAAAQFAMPGGVVADASGNLYVADSNNQTIRKIVIATGVVTTLAGTAGVFGSADGTGAAARFVHPLGITADAAGNVYVVDTESHTIRKIVTASAAVSTVAGVAGQQGVVLGDLPGGLSLPHGVTSIDLHTLAVTTANGVIRIVLP